MKEGDRVPSGSFQTMAADADQPTSVSSEVIFSSKNVVVFGVPGAYTTVCSAKHLPQYVERHEQLRAKGVDTIACLSVNDAFVMREWGKVNNALDKIMMLADYDCSWAENAGLTQFLPALGKRMLRFSMYVEDEVVKLLNVEEAGPMSYKVSGPDHMLARMEQLQAGSKET